jgi:cyclohexadienyl dehydratase
MRTAALRSPLSHPLRRLLSLALSSFAIAGSFVAAGAETLRVGTSGDYAPFSAEGDPGEYTGFSLELARRYAADRGLTLEIVRFRWPGLVADLEADHFDVAMSGVTIRPERVARGIFTVPVVETGAVVLVKPETWTSVDQLDRQRIRIGVNAGGHLERVAQRHLPRATHVAIPDNASVLNALIDDAVQAVITDSAEAPIWRARHPELVQLDPLTRDRKALLVSRRRPELAADLDDWLVERERDGTLAALRREHLGDGPWSEVARPFPALLAAIDERLSLMPTVAMVKRATGVPLEVPERESVVIEAAATGVLEAASKRDVVPPSYLLIQRFFRIQLDAAKQIQRHAVADHDLALEEDPPDLDADLRPALLHIGSRIARLIVQLPPLQAISVFSETRDGLRAPFLARSSVTAIAEAIVVIAPSAGSTPPPPTK